MTPRAARVVSAAGERMGTVTLTEFLLARIAEDEAAARAATAGPWFSQGGGYVMPPTPWSGGRTWEDASVVRPNYVGGDLKRPNANGAHIARHDPARVLAECEAKRRIVELHGIRVPVYDEGYCDACIGDFDRLDERMNAAYPCDTLRTLAAVYADHSDYCEEWA